MTVIATSADDSIGDPAMREDVELRPNSDLDSDMVSTNVAKGTGRTFDTESNMGSLLE